MGASFKILVWLSTFLYSLNGQIDILEENVPIPPKCPRHRKPWHLSTDNERALYRDGLLQLSQQGKLQVFTEQHLDIPANTQAHGNSAFFPWHRYYIWELESQFRELGDDYDCFALPYWDWGSEVQTHSQVISDFDILNSGLGSNGDPSDNYCLHDGSFQKGQYTPAKCGDHDPAFEGADGVCCLTRRHAPDGLGALGDVSSLVNLITATDEYGSDMGWSPGFRRSIETPHGWAHGTMGGQGHLGSHSSPDDPIFWLLHTYIDFLWALWQDCHDYDLVGRWNIPPKMYTGTRDYSKIDDELKFSVFGGTTWAFYQPNGWVRGQPFSGPDVLQIGDMQRIDWWDVSYERGSFFQTASDALQVGCNNINPNWFKTTIMRPWWPYLHTVTIPSPQLYEPPFYAQFAELTFNRLFADMFIMDGNDTNATTVILKASRATTTGLIQSWATINCQMLQSDQNGVPCQRPKCFDDCSDMIPPCEEEQDSSMDINITLAELIEKVRDYPCMVRTRKMMYEWAELNGNLLGLCRGDYDMFCDGNDVIYDRTVDTCSISDELLYGSVDNGLKVSSSIVGGRGKRNVIRVRTKSAAHGGLYDLDNNEFVGVDDKGVNNIGNEWIFGGMSLMVVFNVIGCFYLDNKWKKKLQKEGMKYIDQDDIKTMHF